MIFSNSTKRRLQVKELKKMKLNKLKLRAYENLRPTCRWISSQTILNIGGDV